MACASLTSLPRACGAEGNVAGLEKLYIISYADLDPSTGTAGDPIYTTAVGGMISDIGLKTGKTYVEIGLAKSTSGIKETLTKNDQNGVSFLTQEITLVLHGLSLENRAFINSVKNQPVSILVRSRMNKWFVTGLNGQLELSAMEGGTGTAQEDLNGYTLTFSGIDAGLIPQVEQALIATLLPAA